MSRPAASIRSIVIATIVGIVVAVALTTSVSAGASSSYSASSYAARLLALVNAARQSYGEQPLALTSGTTSVAATWTQHLADDGALSHNPRLAHQLAEHGSRSWLVYGENVGVGSAEDPDGLFNAYMHSPEHRANILSNDYRFVGVSVVIAGSRAWNTFDFVDVYADGSSAVAHRAIPGRPHVRQRSTSPRQIAHPAAATTRFAATHSVAAAAATTSAPPVRPTRRAARAAGPVVVHVKGLQHTLSRPRAPAMSVSDRATTWSRGLVANVSRDSRGRALPVAVALAVMALCFCARRWVLTPRTA